MTLALDLVVNPVELLARHLRGDWGNVPLHYAIANNIFLSSKELVVSVYNIDSSTRIYVATEISMKRTVLLAEGANGDEFELMKDELEQMRAQFVANGEKSPGFDLLSTLAGNTPD